MQTNRGRQLLVDQTSSRPVLHKRHSCSVAKQTTRIRLDSGGLRKRHAQNEYTQSKLNITMQSNCTSQKWIGGKIVTRTSFTRNGTSIEQRSRSGALRPEIGLIKIDTSCADITAVSPRQLHSCVITRAANTQGTKQMADAIEAMNELFDCAPLTLVAYYYL